MEKMLFSGVQSNSEVALIAIKGIKNQPGIAAKVFGAIAEEKINVELILQSIGRGENKDISFVVAQDEADHAVETLKKAFDEADYDEIISDKEVGIVSIVGAGMMDQVDRVIYDLKNNPYSRRIMTNIYVHQDLHEMNLYPCAYSVTFNVTKKPGHDKLTLNAILNQRSQDILAANNWNVVQYAALVYMMAQVCDMEAGELVHVIADAHIYDRHIPIIKEMIKRETYPAPKVTLNPEVKDFYEFTTDDFKIEDYQAGEQIKDIPIAI